MVTISTTTIPREDVWRAFRQTHEARRRERYRCILLLCDGKSCPEMALWLYREEDTMRSWGHACNQGGLQGLERESIPGRPACLTAEQRAQVKEAVRRCPRELGDHRSVWTTTWVRHFIATRLGVEYRRERGRPLLPGLGCRLRRLRHRHLQGNPEEQAAFRAELEELLAAWPAEWELLCVDEATGRRHPPLTAQWCLVDDVPEVPTGDIHPQVHVDGAVAPLSGRTHYHLSPEWGQAECAQFLRHLLADHPGTQRLSIHDRGAQQKGAAVEEVVREASGRLMLKAQPAYSPELNPPERIWKWLRRVVTHQHWVVTLHEQIDAIRNFLRYLAGVKDQVRRLCGFKTPESLVVSL
jgi:transposase